MSALESQVTREHSDHNTVQLSIHVGSLGTHYVQVWLMTPTVTNSS